MYKIVAITFIISFIGCVKYAIILNEESATRLAVDLANQECKKLYGEQPFLSEHYKTTFSAGRWHWGYIDAAGIKGYSTEVSFKKDGTDRKVEIQFHTISPYWRKTSTPQKERRTIIKK